MRVVSLVPSWTETLLECGVDVVGRTRFCVHPAERVKDIPVVGGTKDLDWKKIEALKPDLLLLDKEENLPWMAEPRPWKVHCTHVENISDMPRELESLSQVLRCQAPADLAREWKRILEKPVAPLVRIADMPGVLEWVRRPAVEPEHILYMIWRGPWMAVSRETFVGSMLEKVGIVVPAFPEKYPKIDLANFSPEKTLLLFSSEPYPFGKKKRELLSLDFPSAIVDGEAYSWFGVRSLRLFSRFPQASVSSL